MNLNCHQGNRLDRQTSRTWVIIVCMNANSSVIANRCENFIVCNFRMAYLSYTSPTKQRVTMRINDSFRSGIWWWYNCTSRRFDTLSHVDNYVSSTAGIRGEDGGRKIVVSTVRGTQSVLFIASRSPGDANIGNRVVGSIVFNANGQFLLADTPSMPIVELLESLNTVQRTTMIGIVGFDGPATFNIYDVQADDEDIVRLKANETKLFIPTRYRTPTQAYDDLEANGESMIEAASTSGTARQRLQNLAIQPPTNSTFYEN